MYTQEKKYFDTDTELLDYVKKQILDDADSPVAIIGGHYMLAYDKVADDLKPLIWQDLDGNHLQDFAKLMAGNFPLDTFKMSLDIWQFCKTLNREAKIALLVNDHKFQSAAFQPNIATLIKGRPATVRKNYYGLKDNSLPKSYIQLLRDLPLYDYLLSNDDSRRTSTNTLPKMSYCFSEQVLRNRFDKYTKIELLKLDSFTQKLNKKGKPDLYFLDYSASDLCLTENGSCACSGEVIEIILHLLKRKYKNILFFIPEECFEAVNAGLTASLHIESHSSIKIWAVGNLGGANSTLKTTYDNLKVTLHLFN